MRCYWFSPATLRQSPVRAEQYGRTDPDVWAPVARPFIQAHPPERLTIGYPISKQGASSALPRMAFFLTAPAFRASLQIITAGDLFFLADNDNRYRLDLRFFTPVYVKRICQRKPHVRPVFNYAARRPEAALIVSLIASYLKRTQRTRWFGAMWAGVFIAAALCPRWACLSTPPPANSRKSSRSCLKGSWR